MLNSPSDKEAFQADAPHLDPYAILALERGIFDVKNLKPIFTVLVELNEKVSLNSLQKALKNPTEAELPEDFAKHFLIDTLSLEMDSYVSPKGGFLTGGFITARVSIKFLNWQIEKARSKKFSQLFKSIMLAYDVEGTIPNPLALRGQLGNKALTLTDESVVMAVIDDAIPFAHPRFRLKDHHTRYFSAWLQGKNQTGDTYSEQQFNSLLKAVDYQEVEFSKALGQINLTQTSGSGVALMRRASHGACVSDLLAGYEQGDNSNLTRPMIGVQLPRPIVEDLSGLTLSPYILNAVYFILLQSKIFFTAHGKQVPIVINLSYALFSGSRKQSHPLGRALNLIMARYNKKYPKAPVSLVLPAGNHFQSRSHAVLPIKVMDTIKKTVNWSVLPDDRTDSFMECWLGNMVQDTFQLTLKDPNGKTYAINKNTPFMVNSIIALKLVQNSPLGKGYCVHIALAPTKSQTNSKTVPHGLWEIEIVGLDVSNPAHLWILRDDSPLGFPQLGRQSRFEDEHYALFGAYGRVNESDSLKSSVRRHGTLNAIYAETSDEDDIVICGGSYESNETLTPYSSAGVGTNFRAPNGFLASDQSFIRQGVLAAGTRGGSFTVQNGTSVSAPQLARKIADERAKGNMQPAAKIVKALTKRPPLQTADMRSGWGAIAPSLDAKLQVLWGLRH